MAVRLSIGVLLSGSLLFLAHKADAREPYEFSLQGRGIERKHMAPSHIEGLALRLVADRYTLDAGNLKVASSNKPNFPLTRAVAYQIIIIDKRDQEHYSVTLDEDGNEVDLEKLYEDERAVYRAVYGSFEPRLAERLKTAEADDLIPVLIEPRFPPDSSDRPKYPYMNKDIEGWHSLPEEEKDRIRKMEEAYERRLDIYLKERAKQASAPIVGRLRQMGYEAKADKLNGAIRTALKPDVIKEIVEWEDVRHISLDMQRSSRAKMRMNRSAKMW